MCTVRIEADDHYVSLHTYVQYGVNVIMRLWRFSLYKSIKLGLCGHVDRFQLTMSCYRSVFIVISWTAAYVEAQRSAWSISPNDRQNHVSLGRLSLSPSSWSLQRNPPPLTKNTTFNVLDISSWQDPSENYHLRASQTRANTAMASVGTRVRKRRPVVELEEDMDMEGPSAELLHELAQPLVKAEVWEQLSGQEFNNPSMVEALSRTGIFMAEKAKNNEWVAWKAADKTTSQAEQEGNEQEVIEEGGILVYLGKWKKEGYGSNVPVVKSISIIDMSPKDMAELLLDSSRVKAYNKMSIGRKDVRVMQAGVDTHGHFGHGCTKVVRNITKPPVAKKKMLAVTMMHGRQLRPTDGISEGGYIVVSRAVGDPGVETEDYLLSEILLGVNVLRNTPVPNQCRVTAVTHVYSPSLPTMLASRLGVKGALNFVKDIRSLCGSVESIKVVASN